MKSIAGSSRYMLICLNQRLAVLRLCSDPWERVFNEYWMDVTIVYQGGARSFWALLSGSIRKIKGSVQSLPVSPELLGDYTNDEHFRKGLQRWLNNLWEEKDRCIEELMTS